MLRSAAKNYENVIPGVARPIPLVLTGSEGR